MSFVLVAHCPFPSQRVQRYAPHYLTQALNGVIGAPIPPVSQAKSTSSPSLKIETPDLAELDLSHHTSNSRLVVANCGEWEELRDPEAFFNRQQPSPSQRQGQGCSETLAICLEQQHPISIQTPT